MPLIRRHLISLQPGPRPCAPLRGFTEGRTLYLPFVVEAELRRWNPALGARLELFPRNYILVESARDVTRNWVAVRAHAQRQGTMIERQDAWVAAVALTLDLPLVMHNAAHFQPLPFLQILTEPDR